MINNIIRSVFAVIIGVLLILLRETAMPFLVRLVGAAFLLPALVSIVNVYASRKGASPVSIFLVSLIDIGSMAFGIWLLLFPLTFLELIVVVLAIILLLFSIYQMYMVISSHKGTRLRWGLLAVPLLLAVISVVVLSNPFGTIATASAMLGAAAVVSGLSDILIYFAVRKSISRSLRKNGYENEEND